MTQYDFGIVPFIVTKDNRHHLDSALPNKLFEYLAAGLPVIVRDLQCMASYVKREKVGIVFDQVQDIIDIIEELKNIDVSGKVRTFEDEIEKIEKLYEKVLRSPRGLQKEKIYKAWAISYIDQIHQVCLTGNKDSLWLAEKHINSILPKKYRKSIISVLLKVKENILTKIKGLVREFYWTYLKDSFSDAIVGRIILKVRQVT